MEEETTSTPATPTPLGPADSTQLWESEHSDSAHAARYPQSTPKGAKRSLMGLRISESMQEVLTSETHPAFGPEQAGELSSCCSAHRQPDEASSEGDRESFAAWRNKRNLSRDAIYKIQQRRRKIQSFPHDGFKEQSKEKIAADEDRWIRRRYYNRYIGQGARL